MPFNDKGEFIRARRSAALAAPVALAKPVTTPRTQARDHADRSRDDLLTLAKGFGALVLLAGMIWFVVVFHKWIALWLGLWLMSCVREWLQ